ncbi:MAG: T9SS type A sorting domain-containing protein [Saprospiraceae bacterium]
MKKIPIILLLAACVWQSRAQSISPQVIASSGGFYNNAYGMLSFTTGEMSAVETYTSPSAILTQGFQQTWDIGTYITEHPMQDFSFGIYPNPSDGYFNLVTKADVNEYINVKILDVLDREILQTTFYHQNPVNIQSFDLSNAAPGIYLIALTIKENKSNPESHYITKIQIIK